MRIFDWFTPTYWKERRRKETPQAAPFVERRKSPPLPDDFPSAEDLPVKSYDFTGMCQNWSMDSASSDSSWCSDSSSSSSSDSGCSSSSD